MSAIAKSPAVSLQEAKLNIATQQKRKELLELIHPTAMTDEKVNAFVKGVLTWFPVYTHYGKEANKTLKFENVKIFSDLGRIEADKGMAKFKAWLTGDIKNEIENINLIILNDTYFINARV